MSQYFIVESVVPAAIPAQNLARMAEEQRAAAEKQAELMTANWRQWEGIDTRAVEPRTDRHVESRSM